MKKLSLILGIITIIAALLMVILTPIVGVKSNLPTSHIIYVSYVAAAFGGFIIWFVITILRETFRE
jgi:hypothetical protein